MINRIHIVEPVFNSLYKKYLNKTQKLRNKYLIIFCGIPGSGKTFVADILEKTGYFIKISSDDIKNFLRSKRIKLVLSDLFFIQHKIIVKFLKMGFSAVSDSNSDQVSYRMKLKLIAKRNDANPLVLFFPVDTNLSIGRYIRKRNLKSIRQINSAIKMIKNYEALLSKPNKAIKIECCMPKEHTINNLKKELIKYDKIFYNVFNHKKA